MKSMSTLRTVLVIVTIALALALLFVFWVYPEVPTASYTMGALLIASIVALSIANKKALQEAVKSKNFKYGSNAMVTVLLVFCILIILNVLNYNQYYRKDLTKTQQYALSEQTIKVLKNLRGDLNVTLFDKTEFRERDLTLLKNYIYYAGSKMKMEFVDPDKDPARAKAMNVNKYGTVVLALNGRETRVDGVEEEKITNGLIKIMQERNITVCFIEGHGEKDIDRTEFDGLSMTKTALTGQTYSVRKVSLIKEANLQDACSSVVIVGPQKAFFEKEIEVLGKYLDNGGKAVIAIDPNLRGTGDLSPELVKLANQWFVDFKQNLILDPNSQKIRQGAEVAVADSYSSEHAITKDFRVATYFPIASSLEIRSGEPKELKINWLARTAQNAVVRTDFKQLATGKAVIDFKKDKTGPHVLMYAIEGKRSVSAKSSARLIFISTSNMAINQFARYGSNLDLFVNAISWTLNDENLITIRKKDEESAVFNISQAEGRFIGYTILFIIPGLAIAMGVFVWIRRRRL